MLLRSAHDLGYFLLDARRRCGWSQSRLAAAIGVSRQWVSMAENGKTSVEFDLAISALHALGCSVHIESRADAAPGRASPSHNKSKRTQLTRGGKPLTSRGYRRKSVD